MIFFCTCDLREFSDHRDSWILQLDSVTSNWKFEDTGETVTYVVKRGRRSPAKRYYTLDIPPDTCSTNQLD